MKKIVLFLLFSISLYASANNSYLAKSNESNITTCSLNVVISSTLDIPTSTFFVDEFLLNGLAPYNYTLDGAPSPDGRFFYTAKLATGLHTVVVTDANGCKGTGTFTVQSLAIAAADAILPNFNFYPNPVAHNLFIGNTDTIETAEIIALTGKIVLSKNVNSSHSEIDLSQLATGIYFLKVKSTDQEKIVKFIKQ